MFRRWGSAMRGGVRKADRERNAFGCGGHLLSSDI